MTELSVNLNNYNYVVYEVGYYNRLYNDGKFLVLDDGRTLPQILSAWGDEAGKDLQCVAIYDYGDKVYLSEDAEDSLREFIAKQYCFSGIVFQAKDKEENEPVTLDNYDVEDIKKAVLELGHCGCIGCIHGYYFHIFKELRIFCIEDDTESG